MSGVETMSAGRRAPFHGPLAAPRHRCLLSPPSLPCPYVCHLGPRRFLHLFISRPRAYFPVIVYRRSTSSFQRATVLFFFLLLFSVSARCRVDVTFISLIDCLLYPHVCSLISISIINWGLISGWLIQGDHNNEGTDNRKRKSAPTQSARPQTRLQEGRLCVCV